MDQTIDQSTNRSLPIDQILHQSVLTASQSIPTFAEEVVNQSSQRKPSRQREESSVKRRFYNSCHSCKCGATPGIEHVRCVCGHMYCSRSRCSKRLGIEWRVYSRQLLAGHPCVHCLAFQEGSQLVCPNSNCKQKKKKGAECRKYSVGIASQSVHQRGAPMQARSIGHMSMMMNNLSLPTINQTSSLKPAYDLQALIQQQQQLRVNQMVQQLLSNPAQSMQVNQSQASPMPTPAMLFTQAYNDNSQQQQVRNNPSFGHSSQSFDSQPNTFNALIQSLQQADVQQNTNNMMMPMPASAQHHNQTNGDRPLNQSMQSLFQQQQQPSDVRQYVPNNSYNQQRSQATFNISSLPLSAFMNSMNSSPSQASHSLTPQFSSPVTQQRMSFAQPINRYQNQDMTGTGDHHHVGNMYNQSYPSMSHFQSTKIE